MTAQGWAQKPLSNLTGRSARGTASELTAAAHLLRQGYYVFRAVGPHSPIDLIAYKAGEIQRVEVKSVNVERQNPAFPAPKNDEWDLLIVLVTKDGREVVVELPHRESLEEVKATYYSTLTELGLIQPPKPRRTECPHGHRYTAETTGRNLYGHRFCRVCYPYTRHCPEEVPA